MILFFESEENSPDFTKPRDAQKWTRTLNALFDQTTNKSSWPENTAFWQPAKLDWKSRSCRLE